MQRPTFSVLKYCYHSDFLLPYTHYYTRVPTHLRNLGKSGELNKFHQKSGDFCRTDKRNGRQNIQS